VFVKAAKLKARKEEETDYNQVLQCYLWNTCKYWLRYC